MLDPDWTPARGYAHALDLLARLERAQAECGEGDPHDLPQEQPEQKEGAA